MTMGGESIGAGPFAVGVEAVFWCGCKATCASPRARFTQRYADKEPTATATTTNSPSINLALRMVYSSFISAHRVAGTTPLLVKAEKAEEKRSGISFRRCETTTLVGTGFLRIFRH